MVYGVNNGYNPMNPYVPPQVGQQYYNQSMGGQNMSMSNNGMSPQTQYNNNAVNTMGAMQQGTARMYVRPVSNYDEAKASLIDLDGSMYVFTDIANKCIYTKQVMLDGTAELKTYALVEQNATQQVEQAIPVEVKQTGDYVLKKDYNKAMKQINEKLNKLISEVYDESANDDTNARKK